MAKKPATKAKAKKTVTTRKATVTRKPAVKATAKKAAPKTTAKKSTAKKSTAITAAKNIAAKKVVARKDALTKSGIVSQIVDDTGLTKAQVSAMFDSLSYAIECQVGPKNAAGHFTIPGLCKIVRTFKPAKKARKGVNPFTGEEAMFKAKPAHYVLKVRPLKKLKDMVGKTK